MARVHLLLVAHLLDRIVVDFVHGVVGQGGFAGVLQHRFHQHPVMIESEPAADVVALVDLLLLGGLRHDNDVGEIRDQIIALLIRRHLRHVAADFLLGEGKVAQVDVDAVGAGDNRIVILRAGGGERSADERRHGKRTQQTADERTIGGHGTRSFRQMKKGACQLARFGADTRRIVRDWQWQIAGAA